MSVSGGPDIVTDGLVLAVDAANIKSYSGSGTTWTDLSGNGNNCTLTNGPTFDSKNGGSIVFDGVDDRAYLASTTTYGNNNTWEAWVNRTSSVNGFNMFMGRVLPYFGIQTYTIIFSNTINGVQSTIYSTGFTPQNNVWYHLVFSTEYDGANTTAKIYINGILNNSGVFAGAQSQSATAFTIGDGRSTSTWFPFNGVVANVKVYNRTLSANEIFQNFNATRSRYGV